MCCEENQQVGKDLLVLHERFGVGNTGVQMEIRHVLVHGSQFDLLVSFWSSLVAHCLLAR